eukprot:g15253.t1
MEFAGRGLYSLFGYIGVPMGDSVPPLRDEDDAAPVDEADVERRERDQQLEDFEAEADGIAKELEEQQQEDQEQEQAVVAAASGKATAKSNAKSKSKAKAAKAEPKSKANGKGADAATSSSGSGSGASGSSSSSSSAEEAAAAADVRICQSYHCLPSAERATFTRETLKAAMRKSLGRLVNGRRDLLGAFYVRCESHYLVARARAGTLDDILLRDMLKNRKTARPIHELLKCQSGGKKQKNMGGRGSPGVQLFLESWVLRVRFYMAYWNPEGNSSSTRRSDVEALYNQHMRPVKDMIDLPENARARTEIVDELTIPEELLPFLDVASASSSAAAVDDELRERAAAHADAQAIKKAAAKKKPAPKAKSGKLAGAAPAPATQGKMNNTQKEMGKSHTRKSTAGRKSKKLQLEEGLSFGFDNDVHHDGDDEPNANEREDDMGVAPMEVDSPARAPGQQAGPGADDEDDEGEFIDGASGFGSDEEDGDVLAGGGLGEHEHEDAGEDDPLLDVSEEWWGPDLM